MTKGVLTAQNARLPVSQSFKPQRSRLSLAIALDEIESQRRQVSRRGWLGLIAIAAAIGLAAGFVEIGGAIAVDGEVRAGGEPLPVRAELGGRLAEVLVKEGEFVEAGQILLRLDDRERRVRIDELGVRKTRLEANDARLIALIEGGDIGRDIAEGMFGDEQSLLLAKERQSRQEERRLAEAQIAGVAAQSERLTARIAAQRRELAVTRDELSGLRSLLERGLTAQARVRGLERLAENLIAEIAASESELAALASRRGEVEQRLKAKITAQEAAWLAERQRIDAQIDEVAGELMRLKGAGERAFVTAASSGIVARAAIRAPGTVIAAGEVLMEIVTTDERPIVVAELKAADIGEVATDQEVRIDLSRTDAIQAESHTGRISLISADARSNDNSGKHFKLEIELSDTRVDLVAGTPLRIWIPTEKSSLLAQLLAPLSQRLRAALASH